MAKHMSNQKAQLLLAASITLMVTSLGTICIAVYEERLVVVQFAFAVFSVAVAISVQLSSHDDSVKRAVMIICGVLAPIWFIITGISRLSG
jgi:hypothetical protein